MTTDRRIKDMRYTHVEGHCVIRYSQNGQRVFTGGADGEVRVFKDIDDEDHDSFLIGDETLALAVTDDKFYASASNTNKVMAYSLPEGEEDRVVTRFTADVTALDVVRDILVAGSEDMTFKTVNLDSFKEHLFTGHEAPILSVGLDPIKAEYVVSTSCDGSIRLWNVEKEICIKNHASVLPKSNDLLTSKTLAQIRWNPVDGSSFAVAQKTAITLYDRTTGNVIKDLKSNGDNEDEYFRVVDWSPDAEYIVAGTSHRRILIWKVADGVFIAEFFSPKKNGIRGIAWNPTNRNEISFLDEAAYWGICSNVLDGNMEVKDQHITPEKEKDEFNEEELVGLFDDDDDDDNSFSIKKIKAETGYIEGDDGETKFISTKATTTTVTPEETSSALNVLKQQENQRSKNDFPVYPKVELQEAFQSGSTPVHLSSRFMVWNSVGIVKSFDSEEENSIDVEFHDTAVHHPLHLSNVDGYTMADLSQTTVALATEGGDDDSDAKSKLTVHYFGSSDKEWSLEMPDNEEILALTLGSEWVAVATDKRNLRFFTLGGIQKEILSLPGPVVTLAGFRNKLMVVIHSGGIPLPGNQCLSVAIFDLSSSHEHPLPHFMSLPLAPCSLLTWAGFSDEGNPVIMDDSGLVKLFKPHRFMQWIQVCDTSKLRKGKSDRYFMVGLSEREDSLRAILCKGARYPVTVPKPTVTLLSLQLPLCELGTEKTTLEEKYWKAVHLDADDDDDDGNETLLKLFALSCKSDQDSRAIEVCKLMDSATIQVAVKYATKLRRIQLANKLNDIVRLQTEAEQKERITSQRDMFEYEDEIDMNAVHEDDSSPSLIEKEEEKQQPNPLVAVKLKKKRNNVKSIAETQTRINPFKKNSEGNPVGTIRSGIVFDSMSNKPIKSEKRNQFGSREHVEVSRTSKINKEKQQTLFVLGKENSTSEESIESSQTPVLKGFQLWLAENCQDVTNEEENKSIGLKKWKDMSKEEKEKYKKPRAPKRKRSEDDYEELKPSKSANKLKAFAAPE